MEELKLLGYWPSPFSRRVIWALKLKGLSYEYIEEDLQNKSNLLLQCNPVHKKIPVLIHRGNPVCDSMVILQYIDETWPQNPLLPQDAYERSVILFWAKFIDEQVRPMWRFFTVEEGEKQEEAIRETLGILRIIEEHGLGENKFFGGNTSIGLADIMLGWVAHVLEPMQEIVGTKFIQPHTFPRLHRWVESFRELPIIKDNLPDRREALEIYKQKREMHVASPSPHHH